MCEYVNPEYGVLDNFIESMTGIKNRDIKQAPKLTEALEHLTDWLGDRKYKVYVWSDSDRTQILHEIKAKNIESAKIDLFLNHSQNPIYIRAPATVLENASVSRKSLHLSLFLQNYLHFCCNIPRFCFCSS